ncbi:hypothetical protein BDN67DRAFT_970778 [Paxillus ammoniavirescens]|nr:hypothetical protein BDN67DRAFT_970778 [Paxillus ammoniavirescens]
MSILFIAARYLGLALAMSSVNNPHVGSGVGVFYMSQLVRHSTLMRLLRVAMTQFLAWGGFVYVVVTKAIMILRVAVMFNHPKRTTYILSFLYLLVIIEAFIIDFLWIGPHSGLIISTATLVDDTLCEVQLGRSVMLPVYGGIPGGLFDLLILALSLYRFAVHSIETKRMLGRTKVNVYMRLLFEHSVLYFVLNLANKGLADGMQFSSSMVYIALASLYCSTVPYVLFPRLVLSFKGHRSESSGLYIDSDPPQHSHAKAHAHSYSAASGDPRNEEYELVDVNSPGRVPRSTQGSKKGGPELA